MSCEQMEFDFVAEMRKPKYEQMEFDFGKDVPVEINEIKTEPEELGGPSHG